MTAGAPQPLPSRGFSFPRLHRLKRQRLIRPLFERGRGDVSTIRSGPVTLRYRLARREDVGADVPLQIGFAVGKGVGDKPARNRVKRVLREVYRAHQHGLVDLFSDRDRVLTVMVIYRGRSGSAASAIRRTLPSAIEALAQQLVSTASAPEAQSEGSDLS